MERLSTGFPLALLALLAALTFWLDHIAQPTTTPRDSIMRHDPDYIVENFVAVRTRVDGTPWYQLEAKRMLHYPDDDTTHLENPRILSFDGNSEKYVLHMAASIERNSEHPVAEAVVNRARLEGVHVGDTQNFEALPGKGVTGTVNGDSVLLGNLQLMEYNPN